MAPPWTFHCLLTFEPYFESHIFPNYLQEKSAALESAKEYLEYDPADRDRDIAITVVKQGHEPPHFTGFFGAWDRELFKVSWIGMCSC